MFNSIRGKISEKTSTSIRLLTGGIEWDIEVSSFTLNSSPKCGQEMQLLLYVHHREDQMRLYGFLEEKERLLYLDLLKVGGIGPRQAMRILSGLSAEHIITLLEQGDVEGLSAIPGLGKKTAQKIVLALKGKLAVSEQHDKGQNRELSEALVEMGFDRKQVKEVLSKLNEDQELAEMDEKEREQELFKRAIVLLS